MTAVSVNTLLAHDLVRHAVDHNIIGVRLQEERRYVELHRGIVLLYRVNRDRQEEETQRDKK